jgi:hypothetical protein
MALTGSIQLTLPLRMVRGWCCQPAQLLAGAVPATVGSLGGTWGKDNAAARLASTPI